MFKNLFAISKEDVFHICDKTQYCEASLWEKAKLSFRYLWCRSTRAYVNRNIKLTKAIKSSKVECMEYAERQLLQERFDKQLKHEM